MGGTVWYAITLHGDFSPKCRGQCRQWSFMVWYKPIFSVFQSFSVRTLIKSKKNNHLKLEHIHTNKNSDMLRTMAVWNRDSQNVEIVSEVRNVVAFNVHKTFICPGFVCIYSL